MNTIKKLALVNELCKRINEYVYNYDLFAGGCCYAAYVLAKNLKELGIEYKTVIYQYDDILNETNFNNAINGNGVSHVAIEVRIGFRRYTIGDCSGILNFFNWYDTNSKSGNTLESVQKKSLKDTETISGIIHMTGITMVL